MNGCIHIQEREVERLRRIEEKLSLVNLAWLTEADKEAGEVKTNK